MIDTKQCKRCVYWSRLDNKSWYCDRLCMAGGSARKQDGICLDRTDGKRGRKPGPFRGRVKSEGGMMDAGLLPEAERDTERYL